MSNLLNYITHTVLFDRPRMELPKPNSENANTISIYKNCSNFLFELGYTKEASFINPEIVRFPNCTPVYQNLSYAEHFNLLNQFIDFDCVKEVDGYILTKSNSQLHQPDFLKIKTVEQLNSQLKEQSITTTNCYGRNLLFYTSAQVITYILNNQELNQQIDLFLKDNFNLNPLHLTQDLNSFYAIYKAMNEKDPHKAFEYATTKDMAGNIPIQSFFNLINNTEQPIKDSDFHILFNINTNIKQIAPDVYQELHSFLIEKANNYISQNKHLNTDKVKAYLDYYLLKDNVEGKVKQTNNHKRFSI